LSHKKIELACRENVIKDWHLNDAIPMSFGTFKSYYNHKYKKILPTTQ